MLPYYNTMASITPTRRVLSERNVNTLTGRGAMQPSKLGAGSPAKPQREGNASVQTELKLKEDVWGAVYQEAQMGSRKRESDIHMDSLPSKRHKTVASPEAACEAVLYGSRGDQSSGVGAEETAALRSPVSTQNPVYDTRSSPSDSSSPTSSLGSRLAGLDDSQNTTITELDDAPLHAAIFVPILSHPVLVPLTEAEIREKAEVLKLRLKLASYKVRTNQINIPMSRLQIKTLAPTQPGLPRLPRQAAKTLGRRNPLPSAATALPNIRLQTPSAEKRRVHHTRIHSSPPPYLNIPTIKRQVESNSPTKETGSTTERDAEGCTTPLLPRQRDGLLHPPNLGSPIWNDLTSSVVKGRAADGLLSLMRQ